ncbi:unnamed protein product [Mytilus edulis]|uniref:Endonuclease/exonuclease/phosphatase domain-containing protein n=1 Tax=Mytilus edulis TaxID=6550 RepID=A0A8S3VDS3_MYTED|nr:unnamed protein product [Mytilus edulis]
MRVGVLLIHNKIHHDVERTIQQEVTLPTYTGHSNYNARTSHREQNNGHSSRNHHQQSRKENSTRQIDKDTFFDTLITQVYEHQNKGPFFICGDFNSRCGNESDYIEGVDNLCQRNVIDFKCNSYCNAFIDFLISAYCCILNGRNFVNNDYTCVSTKGCSVVDYCIVPYDNLNLFKDFCVIRANDLVTSAGFDVNGVDLKLIPDHSLIKWSIDLNAFMSNVQPTNDKDETFSTKFEKFDFNKIPANFMNTNNVYQNICSLIESLKTVEHQQNCVNGIYDDFCKTVESEMSDKIPSKTIFVGGKQSNKKYRNRKPWWNESLSKLWYEMCNAEKAWNKSNSMQQKQLKAIYVQKRKHFDSEVQKSKRKYWYDMQEQLLSESSKNQHMFWKKIGKIGIAESRKHVIPMEVIDDDGIVSSEITDVLDKWKSEYSELLNQQNSSIRVSDSCTSLNEAKAGYYRHIDMKKLLKDACRYGHFKLVQWILGNIEHKELDIKSAFHAAWDGLKNGTTDEFGKGLDNGMCIAFMWHYIHDINMFEIDTVLKDISDPKSHMSELYPGMDISNSISEPKSFIRLLSYVTSNSIDALKTWLLYIKRCIREYVSQTKFC